MTVANESGDIKHVYTEDYYLNVCGSYGKPLDLNDLELPRRLKDAILLASLTGREDILDIGCGSGEVSCYAARIGCRVMGIDYSESAVALAEKRTKGREWAARCHFLQTGIQEFLLSTAERFDVIFALDVFEHLSLEEFRQCIKLVPRILKPQGRIVFHTSPNRHYYSVAYRLVYGLSAIFGGASLKSEGRNDDEIRTHIHELTAKEIKSAFAEAGFGCEVKPFALERIQQSVNDAGLGMLIGRILSAMLCSRSWRKWSASDLIGRAYFPGRDLRSDYLPVSGEQGSLEHPFILADGWYMPVLGRQDDHRWSAPSFSFKLWPERAGTLSLRFRTTPNIKERGHIRIKPGKAYQWISAIDHLEMKITLSAEREPVELRFAVAPTWVEGDPRCLGVCLEAWSFQ